MISKTKIERLREGVESLLVKDGYAFSDEDKALLREILVELEEMYRSTDGVNPNEILKVLSLLLRILKFFGINDFSGFI